MTEYIKKIKIGDIELKNNVFLAPMAGVTDLAFRRICREYGPSLTYTEMASAKAMEYGSQKTNKILNIYKDEKPAIVQIFGSNPEVIKNMILKLNENEKIDIIDINMGCPAPKIVKNGDGAGLLLDLENVKKILEVAVKVSKKPITVKTRKGFSNEIITAIDVAKICQNSGVSMITIHGRTREQYYSGQVDLDIIKQVKQSVKIPVIGNGDIIDLKSANTMLEYTGCDGIMIARGAQGNPWLFKTILEQKEYTSSLKERFDTILKQMEYMLEYENEQQTNLKLRKHIAWYLKGLDGSSEIKNKINTSESINDVKKTLSDYFNTLNKKI